MHSIGFDAIPCHLMKSGVSRDNPKKLIKVKSFVDVSQYKSQIPKENACFFIT